MTAQINVVHPGGKAQDAHRDYYLGFQSVESMKRYPSHIHALSPALIIIFNVNTAPIEFVMPDSQFHWRCVFTTAENKPAVTKRTTVDIESRSVQLFELQM